MTKDEALRLALEALEVANSLVDSYYLPKEKAWMPEIEEAITAIKAALEAKDEPVAIKWEKDADKECRYNNWVGITPFGKILITWKGWKEYHDACVDEFPGGFEAYGLPDDVKAACEVEYLRRLYTTLPQQEAKDEPVFNKPHLDIEGPLHVVCRCPACKVQPQRTWVGLTDEDIMSALNLKSCDGYRVIAQAIEAKLKDKNT